MKKSICRIYITKNNSKHTQKERLLLGFSLALISLCISILFFILIPSKSTFAYNLPSVGRSVDFNYDIIGTFYDTNHDGTEDTVRFVKSPQAASWSYLSKPELTSNITRVIMGPGIVASNLSRLLSDNISLEELIIEEGNTILCQELAAGCVNLKTVSLPQSLTEIDADAFRNCKSLTEINIPDRLQTIHSGAFDGCSNLRILKIPNSVTRVDSRSFDKNTLLDTSNPYVIRTCSKNYIPQSGKLGSNANFTYDINTRTMSITGSVAYREYFPDSYGIFIENINLKNYKGKIAPCLKGSAISSIEFPDTITDMNSSVCKDCQKLAKVKLPSSITGIGYESFKGCSSLTTINIPEGVFNITAGAFEGCTQLKSIKMPSKMYNCGIVYWFKDCISLESIQIPYGIERLSTNSFYNCRSLTSIFIPNTVESIEAGAFFGCENLKKVTIPDTVASIDSSAFKNCNNLVIYCSAKSYAYKFAKKNRIKCVTTNSSKIINGAEYTILSEDQKTACLTKYTGSKASFTIPDTVKIGKTKYRVTTIGKQAFRNNQTLQSITLGKYVDYLDSSCFCYCGSLKKINGGKNVYWIGDSAFYKCRSLTSYPFGKTLQYVGSYSFAETGIQSATLYEKVLYIRSNAFDSCYSLKNVTIRTKQLATATNIGSNAFRFINSSCKITVPKSKYTSYVKLLKQAGIKNQPIKKGKF